MFLTLKVAGMAAGHNGLMIMAAMLLVEVQEVAGLRHFLKMSPKHVLRYLKLAKNTLIR